VIGLGYQSTKCGDSTIHPDKIFKGPEGTIPLWTHIAGDFCGQIPWTHSGQETDMEDEKCDE
jgi:hypothetical protein